MWFLCRFVVMLVLLFVWLMKKRRIDFDCISIDFDFFLVDCFIWFCIGVIVVKFLSCVNIYG